jgi:transcriptional regulator with XRE-family HTH domain
LSLRLLSATMAEEDEIYQRRQGFWLRMARERAGKSQAGAAEMIGLSPASKSSISDYENGVTAVPLRMLRRLAEYYAVPLSLFTEPPPTAYEEIDARLGAATQVADMVVTREGQVQAAIEVKQPRTEEDAVPERRRAWWLRDLREKRGLSLGEVARRVGVNSRTVERWEEGASEPSLRQEHDLADLLGAPVRRPPRPEPREDGERRQRTA